MWFLAIFTFVLSVVVLGLSIFPGPLEMAPPTASRIAGGAYMVFAATAIIRHVHRSRQTEKSIQRGSVAAMLLLLASTPTLLWFDVPRRLVFCYHASEFESLLSDAPLPANRAIVPLNANLSVYWVDQWGTDSRGGTYLRTMSGRADGKADRRSFGFVHKPNAVGSPFGDDRYELRHLTGDWYSFSATDDR
ncbi:MAG TPA: hypothetical protein VHR66_17970 [Gemmataceae bacterium]|nr:hypothetical protein [Gemmataceae bacterium]